MQPYDVARDGTPPRMACREACDRTYAIDIAWTRAARGQVEAAGAEAHESGVVKLDSLCRRSSAGRETRESRLLQVDRTQHQRQALM